MRRALVSAALACLCVLLAADSARTFTVGAKGFGGEVVCEVSIDGASRVSSVRIVDISLETPGVGGKCADPKWLASFVGLSREDLPLSKYDFEDAGIDALTGATISSMAIVSCIRAAFAEFEAETTGR